ncbi:Spc98p SCDLUD_002878 [Saccharomycodes ludwigii]|uniref:Spc98p n=1 Tax=Saccharomycodes ludwigii TaxID=36035 RepID=UPI001E81F49B|nr:hypothetical protein SCDLUD_002878 [Saccharomycodes ludwigii]KAH3901386.1 hypothetical protein SCDLUD_002878 [Saccharomycodes ludwigii]
MTWHDDLFNVISQCAPKNVSSQQKKHLYSDILDLLESIVIDQKRLFQDSVLRRLITQYEGITSPIDDRGSSLETLEKWNKLYNIIKTLAMCTDKNSMIQQLKMLNTVLSPIRSDNGSFIIPNNNIIESPYSNRRNSTIDLDSPSPIEKHANKNYSNRDSFESFENLEDRLSEIRSRSSRYTHISKTNGLVPSALEDYTETLRAFSDKYYPDLLSENELLKHMSYTLLGITTALFPIKNDTTIQIQIPTNVSNGDSAILHNIFEASILYQYLNNFLQKIQNFNHNSVAYNITPLKISLLSKLQSNLQTYMEFVNHDVVLARSLKEVYLLIYDKILELRFYKYVIDLVPTKHGDELLSFLKKLQNHGDKELEYWSNDLATAMQGLYETYLINWLTKGELDASFSSSLDFFIYYDNSAKKEEKTTLNSSLLMNTRHGGFIDLDRYKLNKNKIPFYLFSFSKSLSEKLGYKVYEIGKSLLYLLYYCEEFSWVNEFTRTFEQHFSKINIFVKQEEFISIIEKQYYSVIDYIHKVLEDKYYFMEVIKMLKDLLLMGNGNFISIVLRESQSFLNAEAQFLQSSALTNSLRISIQSSSLRHLLNKYDNNEIVNCVDARILESGHGSIGWDVFTLDFIIFKPLEIVIGADKKKNYLKIFNFLWKLKRVEFESLKWWETNNSIVRDFTKLRQAESNNNKPLIKDILSKFSKINCCRHIIFTFIEKVQSYLFLFFIEVEYSKFMNEYRLSINTKNRVGMNSNDTSFSEINNTDNILLPSGIGVPLNGLGDSLNMEELKELHENFIKSLVDHILLTNSNNNYVGKISGQFYSTSLTSMIKSILQFTKTYNILNETMYEIYLKFNLSSIDGLNSILSKFNNSLLQIAKDFKVFEEQKNVLLRDLRLDTNLPQTALELSNFLR